jgi:hypothetical protein
MMMKMENGFHPIMNIMEVVLTLPIKAKRTTFNWMYIDYNTLQNAAFANGLQAELILEGEHYDFLASCQFRNKEKRLNSYILDVKKTKQQLLFGFFI